MVAGQALRPALMLANIVWIEIVGYALNVALIVAQARLFGKRAASRPGGERSRMAGGRACRGRGVNRRLGRDRRAEACSPVFLPTPARVWMALEHGFLHASLGAKLAGTVSHMLGGWLAASIVGVALGALIGTSNAAREYIAANASNSCACSPPRPSSPVAIAIFGLTPQMAIGVIAFGSIWPALLAAIHGFAATRRRLKEVGTHSSGLCSLAGDGQLCIALRLCRIFWRASAWPRRCLLSWRWCAR